MKIKNKGPNMYPFVIKGKRLIRIFADSYKNALNKVLYRYRNKFVQTKFARKVELQVAKEEAAAKSKKLGKAMFVVVEEKSGDCEVTNIPLRGALHKFINGKEDDNFVASTSANQILKEVSTKKQLTMKTKEVVKENKKAVKVAAKTGEKVQAVVAKAAAKKETKKEAEKPAPAKKGVAKKESAPALKGKDWGKKVSMTNKEMTAKIKKGYIYRNEKGQNKTNYIPERPNQELMNENYWEQAPVK